MATTEQVAQTDTIELSRAEYNSVLRQLKELTHDFIDAFATPEACSGLLADALVKLHAARLNLESAAAVGGAS
jgi:hypothetical protein